MPITAAWQGARAAFASGKVWVFALISCLIFFFGYYTGRDSASDDAVANLEAFVKEERERSARDIEAAIASTKLIQVVKQENQNVVNKIEELVASNPDNCVLSPDELRELQKLYGSQ